MRSKRAALASLIALAAAGVFFGGYTFGEDEAQEAKGEKAEFVRALRSEMPGWARYAGRYRVVDLYFPKRGITFRVPLTTEGRAFTYGALVGPGAEYSAKPIWLALLDVPGVKEQLTGAAAAGLEPDEVRVPTELAEKIFALAELTKKLRALEAEVAAEAAALAAEGRKAGLLAN